MELDAFSTIEIFVTYEAAQPLKKQSVTYRVSFENHHEVEFQIFADFKGPSVRVLSPIVDFGIVKSHTNSLS